MDGRKNNGGARPGAGNPGMGKMKFIREQVEKFSPLWWEEIGNAMQGDDKEMKKFALNEFNKIQVKMVPQTIDGGEDDEGNQAPVQINIIKPDEDQLQTE